MPAVSLAAFVYVTLGTIVVLGLFYGASRFYNDYLLNKAIEEYGAEPSEDEDRS